MAGLTKRKIGLIGALVAGVVLLGLGVYFSVVEATIIGNPGDRLHLDQVLSYRTATDKAFITGPVELGHFIGAYLISFKTCDKYEPRPVPPATPTYMECTDERFASGFGMMYLDKDTNNPMIAVPLPGSVYKDSYGVSQIPETWRGAMLWGAFELISRSSSPEGDTSFSYRFAGMIGGNGANDALGRVILQHKQDLKGNP